MTIALKPHRKVGAKGVRRGVLSTYTEAAGAEICRLIAEGQSLNAICKAYDMPNINTVYDWREAHPEFNRRYARARCDQADTHTEEMLDVARASRSSKTSEEVQSARLLVDTLKWRASKMKPGTYGDKLMVDAQVNVREMSDEEIDARLKYLFAHPGEGVA